MSTGEKKTLDIDETYDNQLKIIDDFFAVEEKRTLDIDDKEFQSVKDFVLAELRKYYTPKVEKKLQLKLPKEGEVTARDLIMAADFESYFSKREHIDIADLEAIAYFVESKYRTLHNIFSENLLKLADTRLYRYRTVDNAVLDEFIMDGYFFGPKNLELEDIILDALVMAGQS